MQHFDSAAIVLNRFISKVGLTVRMDWRIAVWRRGDLCVSELSRFSTDTWVKMIFRSDGGNIESSC